MSQIHANIENAFLDVCVEIYNIEEHICEMYLDGGNFHLTDAIRGEQITNSAFAFRIPLPRTIAPGDFVVPVSLFLESGDDIIRSIVIKLTRRKPLPSKVYLDHIPEIVQEKPWYSGAAIASAVKGMHNHDNASSQKDIREMVDAVRNLSGYEPFQTWRIVLRRVLTSQAKNTHELPEFSSSEKN